jgi:hypothetical protein
VQTRFLVEKKIPFVGTIIKSSHFAKKKLQIVIEREKFSQQLVMSDS